HADVDEADFAIQDRCGDVGELSLAVDVQRLTGRPGLVSAEAAHFRGDAGGERVTDDLPFGIDDENVSDPPGVQVLVDLGLNDGRVPIVEHVHARGGEAAGNGLALALVLLGQVPIQQPGREGGGRGDGQAGEQHQDRE